MAAALEGKLLVLSAQSELINSSTSDNMPAEFQYHVVSLNRSRTHNDDTESSGYLQQMMLALDEPDDFVNDIHGIFVFDDYRLIKPFPNVPDMFLANLSVLNKIKMPDESEFPVVSRRSSYGMPPISPGIAYNTLPRGKNPGGFHLVFTSDYAQPLKFTVYARCVVF